ncbi:hypothetical protein L3Q82_000451 [Scortum barcoo]|uniref:Uncharacterized protein n=1 Tax=Scortum barcoo TaxID=214431 RepID=A0ACB8WF24_9TELE|nr:hypothetical protein L3Q82_000451 [Scortum barcoo]
MAKRIADKELTDRNWDQEEEGEEAGTFSIASEDVLKNRAIKKAKRRNIGTEGESTGAFKGFKGFTLTTTAATGGSAPTAFSGFGNGGGFKGLSGLTNGNSIAPSFGGFQSPAVTSTATPGECVKRILQHTIKDQKYPFYNPKSDVQRPPASAKPTADVTAKQTNGSAPRPAQSSGSSSSVGSKEYSRQLTALNCSVRDWITKHVNDNPLCDLNPIFRDYERHLASIERQYGAGSVDGGSEEKKQGGVLPATATPPPAPPASSSSSSPAAPAPPALFSFSKTMTEDSSRDKPAAPIAAGVTFNFDENGEEESEEPPKPEVKEVKEDDAFYSKKCKLFYKKDAEFKEKGVGTLHLKQTDDGKTQMIIRADTNLGNILLNIIVQSSMPCTRVGKNNVMVVCVPNPPVDEKNPASGPVPLLIRVKTGEEDALTSCTRRSRRREAEHEL